MWKEIVYGELQEKKQPDYKAQDPWYLRGNKLGMM